jgi:hypothetical protein
MPDLDIRTPSGSKRVYELLHAARPVFLNFAGIEFPSAWRHRVDAYDAHYEGRWELPVIGDVPAPAAVLIRPDGYVAWTDADNSAALKDAVASWFGATLLPDGGELDGPRLTPRSMLLDGRAPCSAAPHDSGSVWASVGEEGTTARARIRIG